ncbi:MAG: OmpA family protein [Flavobacteriales bacterium]
MKHLILLLFTALLLHSAGIQAQVSDDIEKGDKAFDKLMLDEAMFYYESAYEQSKNDPSITRRIANTYRRMGQLTMSAEWYRRTLDFDSTNPLDMLFYAEALKSLAQYDEAIQWYERYIIQFPEDKRAKSHLADKQYYMDLFADTARYEMKSLRINTQDPVIGICHFEGNRYLLSTVNAAQAENKSKRKTYLQYLDIFEVTLNESNELVNPIRVSGSVNSKYHDGPAYFSAVDQTLYFTRSNTSNGKPMLDKKGFANLKIYSATRRGNDWSGASELKINSDDYSSAHACVSKDGQFLYFASNRDGGFGGTDLYVTQKVGEGWTTAINLGPNVNTEGDEMFPMLTPDGSLYFTSDGHAGLGGTDIFVSENVSGIWLSPKNLGAPINSNHDDFAILYDKNKNIGFFCSNRNGKGNDDIFLYTHRELEYTILAGTILSNDPGVQLAGARIQILNLNTGRIEEQKLTSEQKFFIPVKPGDRIEVRMANGEQFDSNKVVFQAEIPQPVLDPLISMGEYRVDVKKIAIRESGLNGKSEAGSIQSGKPRSGSQNNTQSMAEGSGDKETPEGDKSTNSGAVTDNSNPTTPKTDSNKGSENAPQLNESRSLADQYFMRKEYDTAAELYREGLKNAPDDEYSKKRLEEIEQIKKGEPVITQNNAQAEAKGSGDKETPEGDKSTNSGGDTDKSNAKTPNTASNNGSDSVPPLNDNRSLADQYFMRKEYDTAAEFYREGLKNAPNDEYSKKRLEEIERIKKAEAGITQNAANKPKEEVQIDFDSTPALIDLEGLQINNVIFDFNKSFIREEDKPNLDKVVKLLKDSPTSKLLIKAYCDSRGSMTYNQQLSMSRAMAVQGYFIQKGIPRKRIQTEWFGEQRPLNDCDDHNPCTKEEHEINRRAELKIVVGNSPAK